MSFGETLQTLRKQKGWSQEELAERLELTRQTISKWELEQSAPDLEYIVALSKLFQVSTDYLIKGEERPNDNQETAPAENMENPVPSAEAKLIMMWVIMGTVPLVLGLAGVIVFMALAAVNPAEAYVNGYSFRGLFGFLINYNAVPYFIVCVLLVLAGAALYGVALFKYRRIKN